MRIRLIGQSNTSGIGIHYTRFLDALKRRAGLAYAVETVDAFDENSIRRAMQDTCDTDINISFTGVGIHRLFQGINIQWIVFETTKPSDAILEVSRCADQVWVPSTWGREVLIQNGIPADRVWVVPEGVDPDQFYPAGRPRQPGNKFRYLFNGKYEDRKSCRELLEAWAQVYRGHQDVELIIKSGYFKPSNKLEEINKLLKELKLDNVGVYWGYLNDTDLAELYKTSDVFVFPTKGEGWGLPLIEAAAMGLPIITTLWSAHCDFLRDYLNGCRFIEYQLGPVGCPEFREHHPSPSNDWGSWALPSVDSLAHELVAVRRQYNQISKAAAKNSQTIRQHWTWTRSVDHALDALSVAKKQQNIQP